MTTHVRSADGTDIAVDVQGSGPAVVLVSGASTDRRTNADLAGLLAEHLTVLNHDRRGRGESGDTAPYAVEREIEDIAAVATLVDGPVALWGSSSGAVLSVHAGASGLLPVSKVVLWEPPVSDEDWARENQRAYRRDLDALLADDRREDAIARFMQMVGMPEPMIAQARTSPWFAEAARTTAHSLAHDSDVLGDGTVPVAVAARVTVPALVLDGGGSPPFLHAGADALAAALPFGERRTLEGQTHAFASDVMAAAVREFLT